MATARVAEAERSPRVSTQNFVPTPSPIRPPVRRIWASLPLASSPQVWTPLTALRFRSVRYCLIRLLPDAPSRVVRSCERPCLVDGGFPPSGPQEDLTTTCLTSLFCVHAEHTNALRFASTRPAAGPSGIDDACARHDLGYCAMAGFLMTRAGREKRVDAGFPQAYLDVSRLCPTAHPPHRTQCMQSAFPVVALRARFKRTPTTSRQAATPSRYA